MTYRVPSAPKDFRPVSSHAIFPDVKWEDATASTGIWGPTRYGAGLKEHPHGRRGNRADAGDRRLAVLVTPQARQTRFGLDCRTKHSISLRLLRRP